MIQTDRLLLREWDARDLDPLAAMNADPEVMEFYFAPLTRAESEAGMERYRTAHARDGFGFLAAERKDTGEFIGIIGMQTMTLAIAGVPQPAVEIGWRLAKAHWGRGFATEGARAVLDYGFRVVRLDRTVAITAAVNARSRRVMEKLGMRYCEGLDFPHPSVPAGNWLNPHVVYVAERRG